eukprot:11822496-Prorocentrum_lima.AAC.1
MVNLNQNGAASDKNQSPPIPPFPAGVHHPPLKRHILPRHRLRLRLHDISVFSANNRVTCFASPVLGCKDDPHIFHQ